jgi:hypothetical protein
MRDQDQSTPSPGDAFDLAFLHEGDCPEDEPLAATFVHLHPARLGVAAVPTAARDAAYRLDREQQPCGLALRRGRWLRHSRRRGRRRSSEPRRIQALTELPEAPRAVRRLPWTRLRRGASATA